jgi:5-methyltetrahydrofolate--homocysteine methyltransferase
MSKVERLRHWVARLAIGVYCGAKKGRVMSIAFTPERWEQVRAKYGRWWDGASDRPMLHVTARREPDRSPSRLAAKDFLSQHGLDVDPEDIADAHDFHLSCTEFLADAFPNAWLNFGAGVLAAYCGCQLQCDAHTTWFFPRREVAARDLHMAFDPENRWFRRTRDLARAFANRWRGGVMVGMTDLGGASDVASSFLTGERMLLDLYDAPGEIQRLMWETHALWWHAFREIDRECRASNPGYSCWTPIFSEKPYYMLQSDFCYMIGPEMFDTFVRPELVASCRQLPNSFYHLDGVGELPHLDSLLAIAELKGIQWVQGDGKGGPMQWLDVYRRILDAGKLLQITGGSLQEKLAAVDVLAGEKRNAGRIFITGCADDAGARRALEAFLQRSP